MSATLSLAQAAELGEPIVRSHLGQPLIADVELTALADAAAPVAVRLASADIYRGANIGMHPILAGVNLSVMRRDGRQYLHITSLKPVESENIHLFLELSEGTRRNVREVTLWFTPDPEPAPKPVPAPVLPKTIQTTAPIPPPLPVSAPPAAVPVRAPIAAPVPQPERVRPARVISVPSTVAACPSPKFSEEQIQACAAMDYKNGLLSAQIVELEEKVKQLQLAMAGRADAPAIGQIGAAATGHIDAHAAAVKAPAPPPPKAAAKAAHKEEGGFPWLLVIGAVLLLALVGGGVWFMLSRRKGKSVETAAADSVAWYSKLASRFRRKPKVSEAVVEEAKNA